MQQSLPSDTRGRGEVVRSREAALGFEAEAEEECAAGGTTHIAEEEAAAALEAAAAEEEAAAADDGEGEGGGEGERRSTADWLLDRRVALRLRSCRVCARIELGERTSGECACDGETALTWLWTKAPLDLASKPVGCCDGPVQSIISSSSTPSSSARWNCFCISSKHRSLCAASCDEGKEWPQRAQGSKSGVEAAALEEATGAEEGMAFALADSISLNSSSVSGCCDAVRSMAARSSGASSREELIGVGVE